MYTNKIKCTLRNPYVKFHVLSVTFYIFNLVTDQEAPTITCPPDETTSQSQVSWSPTVTDNLDQSPTITCNPMSGATLQVGQTTTVMCTATDAALNSADCSFSITVGMLFENRQSVPEQFLESSNRSLGKVDIFSRNLNPFDAVF